VCSSEQDSISQATQGIHHLGLSVPDIGETKDFFIQMLGFQQVGGKPDYPAVFVSDGATMLTLWQLDSEGGTVSFNRRKNAGLHHFALKVGSIEALQALHARLVGNDAVEVEFAPEALGDSDLQHMMCFIPGGVRVEFISA